MREDNQHMNYSAADIEKYWKGQMTAAEQHAMEKAALEDPFLADAMEGFENRKPVAEPVSADITELKKRLAGRIEEKKDNRILFFTWWKAAAVVVIVAGAAWLYNVIGSGKEKSINALVKNNAAKDAKQNEIPPAPEKASTITADSTSFNSGVGARADSVHDLAFNFHKAPKKNIQANDKETEKSPEPAAATSALPAEKKQEELNKDIVKRDLSKNEAFAETDRSKKESTALYTQDQLQAKAKGIATDEYKAVDNGLLARTYIASKTFNGNLMDQANKPVANAFIQIPQLNVATQTDNKGYFSFKAQDSTLSVSVASDGFITQNLHLRDKATLNQIVLKPAPASQRDVVVQSNGAEKRKRSAVQEITITIPDAEPVVGWDGYKEYLEKNKKINSSLQDTHGPVVVSFMVYAKWFGNFTIEQSLDEDLDAEAVRLIKEGPAWKLLKGKKAKATVIVKF